MYDKTLYYQNYDVTQQLHQKHNNKFLISVSDGWYKGKLGARQEEYLFGTQTKVLAQLEITYVSGEKEIIGTDASFLWCNNGPVCFTDLKDGEEYDARKEPDFAIHAVIDPNEQRIPTASNTPAIGEHEVFRAKLETYD